MHIPARPSDQSGTPSQNAADEAAHPQALASKPLVSRVNHKPLASPTKPASSREPKAPMMPGASIPTSSMPLAPLPPSLYASAPIAASAPIPSLAPAPKKSTSNPAMVTPGSRVVIPSWLQPFTMPSNTRFTRTPDYLLRQPPVAAPEPTAPPVTDTAIPAPRQSPPALLVPPRQPPRGPATPLVVHPAPPAAVAAAAPEPAVEVPETVEADAPAASLAGPVVEAPVAIPEAAPAAPIVALESAVLIEATPAEAAAPITASVPVVTDPVDAPPPSIQRIAGLIQLGWAEPPVIPAFQDMALDTSRAANEAFAASAELTAEWSQDVDASHHPALAEDVPDLAAQHEAALPSGDVEPCLATADVAAVGETAPSDAAQTMTEIATATPDAPLFVAGFEEPYALGGDAVTFSWPVFAVPVPVPVEEAETLAPVVAPVAAPAPAPAAQVVEAPVPAAHVAAAPPVPTVAHGYDLPSLDLLTVPPENEPDYELSEEFLERNSVKLQQVLHDFGVRGEIIDANPGPVVTLYELEPAPGIKSSRVIGLSADISRSMSAISARVAVVEGRNVIGIELPNQRRETVWLREMLASHEFEAAKAKLGIALGKTIGGEPVIVDLARMPHLLVAGTTGSGKSVAINTMILSLLYRHQPEQCRLIMIDPKMLELSVYEGIPHLLTPVVTDPKKAIVALKWAVREMEERYRKMSRLGVRNIDGFNARVAEARAKGEIITRTVQKGFDRETGEMMEEDEIMDLSPLPFIVIVVDEMADLMMVAGKDIEGAIQRLAQMARAAGIHLIMATQRPSVDVITGTIKANFPTRISFQVTSKIDSRTILGEMGAEQLLGQGDMLYMAGGGRISRVHGPFVSDQEVERVVEHLKAQGRPDYLEAVTAEEDEEAPVADEAVFDKSDMGTESGDTYDQAVAVVMRDRKASTSYIQRRLQIGYNRAASIMERMENEGLVGPANHAGKREILMDSKSSR